LLAGLLFLLAVPLVAAQGKEEAPGTASDRDALIQLVKDIYQAEIRNDLDFLRRTWSPEYVRVNRFGGVRNKEQALEERRTGRTRIERADTDGFHVTVSGDTAIVTHRVRSKARVDGREVVGDTQALRVFVRRDGRWQCLAATFHAIPTR